MDCGFNLWISNKKQNNPYCACAHATLRISLRKSNCSKFLPWWLSHVPWTVTSLLCGPRTQSPIVSLLDIAWFCKKLFFASVFFLNSDSFFSFTHSESEPRFTNWTHVYWIWIHSLPRKLVKHSLRTSFKILCSVTNATTRRSSIVHSHS